MQQPSDKELIRRFRAGDGDALRVLFERHEDILQARIRRRFPPHLHRKVSVSDVLQETRIVAYQRREDFESGGDDGFRNWLLGIADLKAKAAAHRHGGTAKRAAHREVSRNLRPETGQFVGGVPSPSQVAIAAELKELARRAMVSLPDDYRQVLSLAREEQLPLREVAERMGRSREAVKKLYGRALFRFTEAFDKLRGGSSA
jgi:RNA polymerase sigma-70 factor (ECF subfamily)